MTLASLMVAHGVAACGAQTTGPDDGSVTGLVLPNATATGSPDDPDGVEIVSTFDGEQVVLARDGVEVSYGGGLTDDPEHRAVLLRLCPSSPVDRLYLVQSDGVTG